MTTPEAPMRTYPVNAHRPGHLYVYCPACNRPPHETPPSPRCRRCKGFAYLIVEDRRLKRVVV